MSLQKTSHYSTHSDTTIKPLGEPAFKIRVLPLLAKAIVIGLCSGLLAVLFHLSLDFGEGFRAHLIEAATSEGSMGQWILLAFGLFTVVIAASLVALIEPAAGGSGIPHLKAVLLGYKVYRPTRLVLVKFFSGLIGISGGLVMGREGPTIQMSGALGAGLSQLGSQHASEQKILIMAGSGAGLTAAFNAPLAGVVFALEELGVRPTAVACVATVTACLCADLVCRSVMGQSPVFEISKLDTPNLLWMPIYIGLGCLCGALGVVFNKSLLALQSLSRLKLSLRMMGWIVTGLTMGALAILDPKFLGAGQSLIQETLNHPEAWSVKALALFLVGRFLLTLMSYSTGSAGGFFAPVLVMGGLLGGLLFLGFSPIIAQSDFTEAPLILTGMAALFSGVARAPLTAIVLIIEMTGQYAMVLPLLGATYSATLVANALRDTPIYEALLEADLAQSKS